MNLRNYIILKANDSSVDSVYMGPLETSYNTSEIATALDIVTRYLVKKYYQQGYDVIIARGQTLDNVKKSLPELRWNKYNSHPLKSFAESIPSQR